MIILCDSINKSFALQQYEKDSNKIRYIGLLVFFLIRSITCIVFSLPSFTPPAAFSLREAYIMMLTNNRLKNYEGYFLNYCR